MKTRPFTQANIEHKKQDMMGRTFCHDVPKKGAPIWREAVLQMVEDGQAKAYKTGGNNFRWIVTNGPAEHDHDFPFVSRRNEGEEIP